MVKTIVKTDRAPKVVGPYSQGILCRDFVFLAGQIPLDPETGKLVEGDIQAQTRRVLENVKALLTAAGCSFDQVVKTTVFLVDLKQFQAMNVIYAEYFSQEPPARTTIQVAGLPMGAQVEIEVIASL